MRAVSSLWGARLAAPGVRALRTTSRSPSLPRGVSAALARRRHCSSSGLIDGLDDGGYDAIGDDADHGPPLPEAQGAQQPPVSFSAPAPSSPAVESTAVDAMDEEPAAAAVAADAEGKEAVADIIEEDAADDADTDTDAVDDSDDDAEVDLPHGFTDPFLRFLKPLHIASQKRIYGVRRQHRLVFGNAGRDRPVRVSAVPQQWPLLAFTGSGAWHPTGSVSVLFPPRTASRKLQAVSDAAASLMAVIATASDLTSENGVFDGVDAAGGDNTPQDPLEYLTTHDPSDLAHFEIPDELAEANRTEDEAGRPVATALVPPVPAARPALPTFSAIREPAMRELFDRKWGGLPWRTLEDAAAAVDAKVELRLTLARRGPSVVGVTAHGLVRGPWSGGEALAGDGMDVTTVADETDANAAKALRRVVVQITRELHKEHRRVQDAALKDQATILEGLLGPGSRATFSITFFFPGDRGGGGHGKHDKQRQERQTLFAVRVSVTDPSGNSRHAIATSANDASPTREHAVSRVAGFFSEEISRVLGAAPDTVTGAAWRLDLADWRAGVTSGNVTLAPAQPSRVVRGKRDGESESKKESEAGAPRVAVARWREDGSDRIVATAAHPSPQQALLCCIADAATRRVSAAGTSLPPMAAVAYGEVLRHCRVARSANEVLPPLSFTGQRASLSHAVGLRPKTQQLCVELVTMPALAPTCDPAALPDGESEDITSAVQTIGRGAVAFLAAFFHQLRCVSAAMLALHPSSNSSSGFTTRGPLLLSSIAEEFRAVAAPTMTARHTRTGGVTTAAEDTVKFTPWQGVRADPSITPKPTAPATEHSRRGSSFRPLRVTAVHDAPSFTSASHSVVITDTVLQGLYPLLYPKKDTVVTLQMKHTAAIAVTAVLSFPQRYAAWMAQHVAFYAPLCKAIQEGRVPALPKSVSATPMPLPLVKPRARGRAAFAVKVPESSTQAPAEDTSSISGAKALHRWQVRQTVTKALREVIATSQLTIAAADAPRDTDTAPTPTAAPKFECPSVVPDIPKVRAALDAAIPHRSIAFQSNNEGWECTVSLGKQDEDAREGAEWKSVAATAKSPVAALTAALCAAARCWLSPETCDRLGCAGPSDDVESTIDGSDVDAEMADEADGGGRAGVEGHRALRAFVVGAATDFSLAPASEVLSAPEFVCRRLLESEWCGVTIAGAAPEITTTELTVPGSVSRRVQLFLAWAADSDGDVTMLPLHSDPQVSAAAAWRDALREGWGVRAVEKLHRRWAVPVDAPAQSPAEMEKEVERSSGGDAVPAPTRVPDASTESGNTTGPALPETEEERSKAWRILGSTYFMPPAEILAVAVQTVFNTHITNASLSVAVKQSPIDVSDYALTAPATDHVEIVADTEPFVVTASLYDGMQTLGPAEGKSYDSAPQAAVEALLELLRLRLAPDAVDRLWFELRARHEPFFPTDRRMPRLNPTDYAPARFGNLINYGKLHFGDNAAMPPVPGDATSGNDDTHSVAMALVLFKETLPICIASGATRQEARTAASEAMLHRCVPAAAKQLRAMGRMRKLLENASCAAAMGWAPGTLAVSSDVDSQRMECRVSLLTALPGRPGLRRLTSRRGPTKVAAFVDCVDSLMEDVVAAHPELEDLLDAADDTALPDANTAPVAASSDPAVKLLQRLLTAHGPDGLRFSDVTHVIVGDPVASVEETVKGEPVFTTVYAATHVLIIGQQMRGATVLAVEPIDPNTLAVGLASAYLRLAHRLVPSEIFVRLRGGLAAKVQAKDLRKQPRQHRHSAMLSHVLGISDTTTEYRRFEGTVSGWTGACVATVEGAVVPGSTVVGECSLSEAVVRFTADDFTLLHPQLDRVAAALSPLPSASLVLCGATAASKKDVVLRNAILCESLGPLLGISTDADGQPSDVDVSFKPCADRITGTPAPCVMTSVRSVPSQPSAASEKQPPPGSKKLSRIERVQKALASFKAREASGVPLPKSTPAQQAEADEEDEVDGPGPSVKKAIAAGKGAASVYDAIRHVAAYQRTPGTRLRAEVIFSPLHEVEADKKDSDSLDPDSSLTVRLLSGEAPWLSTTVAAPASSLPLAAGSSDTKLIRRANPLRALLRLVLDGALAPAEDQDAAKQCGGSGADREQETKRASDFLKSVVLAVSQHCSDPTLNRRTPPSITAARARTRANFTPWPTTAAPGTPVVVPLIHRCFGAAPKIVCCERKAADVCRPDMPVTSAKMWQCTVELDLRGIAVDTTPKPSDVANPAVVLNKNKGLAPPPLSTFLTGSKSAPLETMKPTVIIVGSSVSSKKKDAIAGAVSDAAVRTFGTADQGVLGGWLQRHDIDWLLHNIDEPVEAKTEAKFSDAFPPPFEEHTE